MPPCECTHCQEPESTLVCPSPHSRQTSVVGRQHARGARTSAGTVPCCNALCSSTASQWPLFPEACPAEPGWPQPSFPPPLRTAGRVLLLGCQPRCRLPGRPHSPVLGPGGGPLAPASLWSSGACLSLGPSGSDLTGLGTCSGDGGRAGTHKSVALRRQGGPPGSWRPLGDDSLLSLGPGTTGRAWGVVINACHRSSRDYILDSTYLLAPNRSHNRAECLAFPGLLARNIAALAPNPKPSSRVVCEGPWGAPPRLSSVGLGGPRKFVFLTSFLEQNRQTNISQNKKLKGPINK